jgi:hypothetical protein
MKLELQSSNNIMKDTTIMQSTQTVLYHLVFPSFCFYSLHGDSCAQNLTLGSLQSKTQKMATSRKQNVFLIRLLCSPQQDSLQLQHPAHAIMVTFSCCQNYITALHNSSHDLPSHVVNIQCFECHNVPHISIMLDIKLLLMAETVIRDEIYLITQ